MLENKRTFKRFDLPLIVKFRPEHGSTPFSLGLTKNLSCEGIALEARRFNFTVHENLELELKLPQNAASVTITGDVVWKRDDGNTSFAGIAFKAVDKKAYNETIEKISSYTNIPLAGSRYGVKGDEKIEEVIEVRPAVKPDETVQKHLVEIKPTEAPLGPGITKQYLSDMTECIVSFLLPKEAAPDARRVTIVGDFNKWDAEESPMKRLKNGDFRIVLTLPVGGEYRFKYLIDGVRWENDWHADKYVPNSFGADDSVVVV